MKTIDQVIKALEMCIADDAIESEGVYLATDALHYLREFQGLSKMWNDKLDKEQENQPLKWKELHTMVGKPIWVEYNFQINDKEFRDNSKRWCIIREFKPWHDTEIIITENGFVLSKNEQVTDWQAYRKERNER